MHRWIHCQDQVIVQVIDVKLTSDYSGDARIVGDCSLEVIEQGLQTFFLNIFFNYSGGDVTLQMSHSVSTERFIAARSSYIYLTHETVLSSVDYHGVLHGLSKMNSLFTRAKWRHV